MLLKFLVSRRLAMIAKGEVALPSGVEHHPM